MKTDKQPTQAEREIEEVLIRFANGFNWEDSLKDRTELIKEHAKAVFELFNPKT